MDGHPIASVQIYGAIYLEIMKVKTIGKTPTKYAAAYILACSCLLVNFVRVFIVGETYQ